MANVRPVGDTGPGEFVWGYSEYGDDAVETDSWLFFGDEGDEWEYVPEQPDNVNHPSHYKHPSGIEVIEITKHESFLRGNIIKYVLRAPHKGSELEDLQKAQQYLKWEIERVQGTDV